MKKFIIGVVVAGAALVLFCCIRVGAREDRWLEELEKEFSAPDGGKDE